MKKILVGTFLLSLALVIIVACTQVTQTPTQGPPAVEERTEEPATETLPPSPTETPAEVEETAPPATETPIEDEQEATEADDDVEALIVDRCSACHSADRVFNADKSESEWGATIDRMVDYGADVNQEEKNQMIEWLISRDE